MITVSVGWWTAWFFYIQFSIFKSTFFQHLVHEDVGTNILQQIMNFQAQRLPSITFSPKFFSQKRLRQVLDGLTQYYLTLQTQTPQNGQTTQASRWLLPTSCFSEVDYFVGLGLKELIRRFISNFPCTFLAFCVHYNYVLHYL